MKDRIAIAVSNLIPFPARRVRRFSERLLILSASRATLSRPQVWINPPVPPEDLGNLLQHLARERPAAVLLLQSIAADMLATIARERGGS